MIRRLLLSSPEFRSVCEDYSVAQDALAHFRERPDAHERPEIGEYETLIRELEAEIAALVETTRAREGSDRTADRPVEKPRDTKNT